MEQHQPISATSAKIRRSRQRAMDCLQDQRQSGHTVKEYCQANGRSEKTFYRWLEKYVEPESRKSKR